VFAVLTRCQPRSYLDNPFTSQVTVVSVAFTTLAANGWVALASKVTGLGLNVTVIGPTFDRLKDGSNLTAGVGCINLDRKRSSRPRRVGVARREHASVAIHTAIGAATGASALISPLGSFNAR